MARPADAWLHLFNLKQILGYTPEDIIAFVVGLIHRGCYARVEVDESLLPGKKAYGKLSYVHPTLVYGYDDEVVLDPIIKTRRHTAEILQPCVEPLDLPSATVAAQLPPVLRLRLLPVRAMRRDQLDAALGEFSVERVGVTSLIANQSFRLFGDKTLNESFADKGGFMRRSRRRVDDEWKTSIVCHHHEFRAFAPLSLTDCAPPFLAVTNVPSMKHSGRSTSPRSRRSSAKASKTMRNVPSLDHCWNLRWQVWYDGKRSGKSCHRAPERSIQSTPLSTSRVSLHGLPRLSSRRGGSGISGANTAHCSSVSS